MFITFQINRLNFITLINQSYNMSNNDNSSDLNLFDLNPIFPFNYQTFSPYILSDHAQIRLGFSTSIGKNNDNQEYVIVCENICNPEYSHYFNSSVAFNGTHLNQGRPKDNPYNQVIWDMENAKINHIVNTLTNEQNENGTKVVAYIIVESNNGRGNDVRGTGINHQLKRRLGFKDFEFVTTSDRDVSSNVTTIIINKKYVHHIEETGVVTLNYDEVEDNGKSKTLKIPYVLFSINNGDQSCCSFPYEHYIRLYGIHISGCASQFPKTGITKLYEHLARLSSDTDIILMGDFNTVPNKLRQVYEEQYDDEVWDESKGNDGDRYYGRFVGDLSDKSFGIFPPPYLTHVNPNGHAGIYDNIIILETDTQLNMLSYKALPKDSLPLHALSLVNCIEDSLIFK